MKPVPMKPVDEEVSINSIAEIKKENNSLRQEVDRLKKQLKDAGLPVVWEPKKSEVPLTVPVTPKFAKPRARHTTRWTLPVDIWQGRLP